MGNLLGAPVTEKETKGGKTNCGLSYGLSSMQGWRIHMEDAHICQTEVYAEYEESNKETMKIPLEGTSLFAVFDGHAGSFAAEFSEETFMNVLSRNSKFVEYAKCMKEENTNNKTQEEMVSHDRRLLDLLEDALSTTFLEFDSLLYATVTSKSKVTEDINGEEEEDEARMCDDSGTTAVVVLLTPRWIICANAGDSRAIYCKTNRRTIPLSYDHKPDDEEEERRIVEAGGYVSGRRVDGDLAVSRGFGDFRFKSNLEKNQLEQKVSPLPDIIVQNRDNENDEFIVLACDGLWDVATNYECADMVHAIFEEGETDLTFVSYFFF